jgi:hypothetical protein
MRKDGLAEALPEAVSIRRFSRLNKPMRFADLIFGGVYYCVCFIPPYFRCPALIPMEALPQ